MRKLTDKEKNALMKDANDTIEEQCNKIDELEFTIAELKEENFNILELARQAGSRKIEIGELVAKCDHLQRTIDLRGIRIEELEKEASWSNHKDLCDAYDSLKAELQRLRESASVEKMKEANKDLEEENKKFKRYIDKHIEDKAEKDAEIERLKKEKALLEYEVRGL